MTTATDPFVAVLTQRMIAREAGKRKPDYSPGLAPDKIIEDLKREEAEREKRREMWRKPIEPTPEPPKQSRPDYADDIDRMVRDLVAAGDVVYDTALQAYRAPYCRRFRFGEA